ncbi:cytochrome c [Aliishimia ponticola]|uniref:Cytochrome c n=1 Tax=Aliishimia ponticola TaxID=2499833 RepID=A0A4S4NEW8_9RHOB|nr:cytochrome c [Aliishimia ponticola]THH37335.1 cytochrome c [Aliishimia ponticola]
MKYILLGSVLVVGACSLTQMQMPTRSEGARLFAENCAACHGADARGAGPETLGIGKVPPDLTTIASRHGGTFPRAQVLSVIDGYRQGTHPDRVMPEFGEGLTDDLVPVDIDGVPTPTPRVLAALLTYLEGIQE